MVNYFSWGILHMISPVWNSSIFSSIILYHANEFNLYHMACSRHKQVR